MRIYDSFDELFTSLQPRLVNYAVRFTGDPAAARDLVQDAYISLWEKYGRKDSRQAPSLLYTIVRNKCLNYLKRRKILENLDPDIPDEADVPVYSHLQYMLLPRLDAFCEVAWTGGKARSREEFRSRLKESLPRYDAAGINYARHCLE